MTNISEARADVYAQVGRLVAVVERDAPRTATEVEVELWGEVLRLGASLMGLFFALQAVKWPVGLAYNVAGVAHQVGGTDAVELGTKFGKFSVEQPVGYAVGRR